MSISGLHITMFAWAAVLALGVLWRRSTRLCRWWPAPHAAMLGGLVLAAGYALFSGWGLPAQRTVLMLATVAIMRISGRRWPWPLVWLLAAAVVVATDPWAMLQAGFWLSFVAVGVLFVSAPVPQPRPKPDVQPNARWAAIGAKLLALLREQSLITLALAPLSLLLFGQVSLVGLLANLVAIPWVTLVVTPLAMLGVLLPPAWDLAAWAVQGLALPLQAMASWPGASLHLAQPPLWIAVMAVGGGVWLVLPLPWAMRALGLAALAPLLFWQPTRPAPGEFALLGADVGQGTAVLVQTANHALLYDAGPRYSAESDAGHRVVVPLLRALGVRLDVLLLSHRDTDHTGGAPAVLAMQAQARLFSSIEDDHALQALRPATRCAAGQRWVWDGVDFEILHPQAADYSASRKSNAMSCVLKVSNGRQAALLTGDIERDQEAALVQAAQVQAALDPSSPAKTLQATMLVVPHHGSKTSSSAAFLDAVQPQIAWVQSGYRNRFGHPAPEVQARYAQRQIRVFDSPRCGAAHWSSVKPEAVVCEREQRQRYWHHRVP